MNYTIIKKYLSGNASEKEVEDFFTWIEESPENKSIFIEYKKIWALSATNDSDHNVALKLIQKKISLNNKKKRIFNALKYAAIFIGVVFVASITYFQIGNQNKYLLESNQDQITLELEDGTIKVLKQDENFKILSINGEVIGEKESEKLIYGHDDLSTDKDQYVYNTLNIPYGKIFNIELSDGSTVILNAGSSLKYPVNFLKGKSREVYLDGEAYFTVSKNKNDAFIVNTDGLNTQVFGTVFNVSSYKNDENTNVVLVEGSIGVYSKKERFNPEMDHYVKPNELASYNKHNQSIQIKETDITSHVAWTEGVLFFKNEPFHNILNKLERHYNVQITNNLSELNNQRFTGMFRIENIDEVLNTFKKTSSFEYIITNSDIIINP